MRHLTEQSLVEFVYPPGLLPLADDPEGHAGGVGQVRGQRPLCTARRPGRHCTILTPAMHGIRKALNQFVCGHGIAADGGQCHAADRQEGETGLGRPGPVRCTKCPVRWAGPDR